MLQALAAGAKAVTGFLGSNPWVGTTAQALFNKRQTDTSYQRTMRDMKAAGINPILAAKVGPLPSAQMQGLAESSLTARQIQVSENQLEVNAAEATSRISKMSDEEKGQEIDNNIRSILEEYYKKNPNAAVWKDLGGKPLEKITFGFADKILKYFTNDKDSGTNSNGTYIQNIGQGFLPIK